MVIGVPKEIKTQEYRVGIAPSGVMELVKRGHSVLVEEHAACLFGRRNGNRREITEWKNLCFDLGDKAYQTDKDVNDSCFHVFYLFYLYS